MEELDIALQLKKDVFDANIENRKIDLKKNCLREGCEIANTFGTKTVAGFFFHFQVSKLRSQTVSITFISRECEQPFKSKRLNIIYYLCRNLFIGPSIYAWLTTCSLRKLHQLMTQHFNVRLIYYILVLRFSVSTICWPLTGCMINWLLIDKNPIFFNNVLFTRLPV